MFTLTEGNQNLSLGVNRGLCSHWQKEIRIYPWRSAEACVDTDWRKSESIIAAQQRYMFTLIEENQSLSLLVNRGIYLHWLKEIRIYHCWSTGVYVYTDWRKSESITAGQQRYVFTLTEGNQNLSLLVNRGVCSHWLKEIRICHCWSTEEYVHTDWRKSESIIAGQQRYNYVHTDWRKSESITTGRQRYMFTLTERNQSTILSLRANRGLCLHWVKETRVHPWEPVEACVDTDYRKSEPITADQQRPVFTPGL